MGDKSNKANLSDTTMSLGDHLEELRGRLIYTLAGVVVCTIIGVCFGKYIINFIEEPYIRLMGNNARLQTLAPADGFVSFVKIALITGLIFSSPWVFYHLWMFVAAGLYPHEKRYVYVAVPFSAALFILGAVFFILIVAPLTMKFLVTFNKEFLGVESRFTFQKYISFVTHLMLVFGLAFQTPTAIFFLNRTGLVSLKVLKRSRKFVILTIVIISAMVTPPDVVSQITLSVPLYLLFELGIILSSISNSRRNKKRTDISRQ